MFNIHLYDKYNHIYTLSFIYMHTTTYLQACEPSLDKTTTNA